MQLWVTCSWESSCAATSAVTCQKSQLPALFLQCFSNMGQDSQESRKGWRAASTTTYNKVWAACIMFETQKWLKHEGINDTIHTWAWYMLLECVDRGWAEWGRTVGKAAEAGLLLLQWCGGSTQLNSGPHPGAAMHCGQTRPCICSRSANDC